MILVDTSVWIDFFSPTSTQYSNKLEYFLGSGFGLCINGIVEMEILMGIRYQLQYEKVKKFLIPFQYCPDIKTEDLKLATEIYRTCRKKGITIRKSADCIIASQCIRLNWQLFHKDRDFDAISKVYRQLVIV